MHNISAPVVLISPGRTGTTLLTDAFARHPGCQTCGETIDLIFDLWNAAQRSTAHLQLSDTMSADELASKFIRTGFLTTLPDEKPHWFQKPIGIPFAFSHVLFKPELWEEKAELYWKVMKQAFPAAQYFTVLRHPCDIVLSYRNRFGIDEHRSWAIAGFLSHILAHRDSPVTYAVSYDSLVKDSEPTLKSLFTFLGLEFHSGSLGAFDEIHTSNGAIPLSNKDDFTWRNQWPSLDPSCASTHQVDAIKRLYQKFEMDVEFPPEFGRERGDTTFATLAKIVRSGNANRNELIEYSENLEKQLNNAHLYWEERAIRQDNDLHLAYLKLEQKQLQSFASLTAELRDLSSSKAWLQEQYSRWHEVAISQQTMIAKIEGDWKKIEEEMAWLKGHAASWKDKAANVERDYVALELGNHRLLNDVAKWQKRVEELEREIAKNRFRSTLGFAHYARRLIQKRHIFQ